MQTVQDLQHDAANVSAHTLGYHITFCITAWSWLQQLERTINMMSMLACLECKGALVEGPGVRDGGVVGGDVGGSH